MNEKITMPNLIGLLSAQSGESKKQCEDFLREFFNIIVDTLSEGENVRIKSFGTFKVVAVEPRKSVDVNTGEQIEIPSHRKITFVPSKEMAEDVNSPFSIFESVEIPDDIFDAAQNAESERELQQIELGEKSEETIHPESKVYLKNEENIEGSLENVESESDIEGVSKTAEYTIDDSEKENGTEETLIQPESEYGIENADTETNDTAEPNDEEYVSEFKQENKKNHHFILGFASGLLFMALACAIAYIFFIDKLDINSFKRNDKFPEKEIVAAEMDKPADASEMTKSKIDSAADTTRIVNEEEVPTQVSDSPIYDTISKTRYLTTMAKDHYGDYNLWPYIYEENKQMLGHPDRIRPGTKVRIPSLRKYGVNPTNPNDISRAKRMGAEIYARYK